MAKKKYWQQFPIYQIYPRSFCDSNGDGIGDLQGIISKLDYIRDLGVKMIWLNPVYKSPLDDMGYDVADYKSIHPDYGSMKDMDLLIQEAKKRDIRIIMDLVVNHTSDEHEWFVKSKDKNSPYHDYYYWRKGKNNNTEPPNNWTSMFTGPAWEYVPEVGEWYLHLYSKKQPDLDWHNPKVLEEVESIITFWLDKGVYGFRCDVINQIYKESLEDSKTHAMSGRGMEFYLMKEGNHKILKAIYEDIFSKREDAVMIGETFNVDKENGLRFLNEHEFDMFFIFDHMYIDKSYNPFWPRRFKAKKFMDIIYQWQIEMPWMANYLENHDQRRSVTRFGDGIHNEEVAKLLGLLNLTLRGTPFVYQGEEIGMTDLPYFETREQCKDVAVLYILDIAKRLHFPNRFALKFVNQFNRDHARTPMQWDESKNGGFSSAETTWLPVNPNYQTLNAKAQEKEGSVLDFYRKLIAYRNGSKTLQEGSFKPLKFKGNLFGFIRECEGERLLSILNFGKKNVKMPAEYLKGETIISNYPDGGDTLRPYEARLIKLS